MKLTYRISLNGAVDDGREWDSLSEARVVARSMWDEYNDEEAGGSTASVVDSDGNVVWTINEQGEIK